jgi:glycosyltransferase involved in cell wall biosynthesis
MAAMEATKLRTETAPARPERDEVPRPALSIAHIAQSTTEGVARCVGDLAKRQVAAGHEVVVCCPPIGDLPRWALEAGAIFEPWPATRSPGPQMVAEVKRLRLLLDGLTSDLFHLHSAKAGLVGRMVIRGRRPTVFQPHAWSWLAASGPVKTGALGWERRAVRWTDRIVCVSDEEIRIGRSAGVAADYIVVANGVDLEDYPVAGEPERQAARARLGIDAAPVVVCLGRLSRQKGQDVLLRAWEKVSRAVPGSVLYLVGDGPERESLESAAPAGTIFTGSKPNAADWLAAADVVALPSRWEGMSMVMLEAMATGRSVVATDVAGAAEALSGVAGALVPPEDPQGLSSALITRLEDPDLATAEGRAGRRRAERDHSLDATAHAMERVYRQVLASRD